MWYQQICLDYLVAFTPCSRPCKNNMRPSAIEELEQVAAALQRVDALVATLRANIGVCFVKTSASSRVRLVQGITCVAAGMPHQVIFSKCNRHEVVNARYAAVLACSKLIELSTFELATLCGFKNHSSIPNAVSVAKGWLESDKSFKKLYSAVYTEAKAALMKVEHAPQQQPLPFPRPLQPLLSPEDSLGLISESIH